MQRFEKRKETGGGRGENDNDEVEETHEDGVYTEASPKEAANAASASAWVVVAAASPGSANWTSRWRVDGPPTVGRKKGAGAGAVGASLGLLRAWGKREDTESEESRKGRVAGQMGGEEGGRVGQRGRKRCT